MAPTAPPSRVLVARARVPACVAPLSLVLALGANAQRRAPGPPRSGPGAAEPTPLRVTTAVVEGRTVQRSVDTVGSLLAWEEAVARSQLSGTVVRLHADLGDSVREGQPPADLDRREADLTVDHHHTRRLLVLRRPPGLAAPPRRVAARVAAAPIPRAAPR